jgi:hypothetical protein
VLISWSNNCALANESSMCPDFASKPEEVDTPAPLGIAEVILRARNLRRRAVATTRDRFVANLEAGRGRKSPATAGAGSWPADWFCMEFNARPYSYRKATIGSTRVARRAGK